jgi:adaptin ear-binding coat-associated protein 1/2
VKPGGDIISFVDGVIDSSRYYVLRLQDRASSRSVLIGIGFRERDTAFDFKNALNDYVRYIDRMSTADKAKVIRSEAMNQSEGGITSDKATTHGSTEKNVVAVSLAQHRDLSIPDGQKITIKSKLLRNTGTSQTSTSSSSTTKSIALRPPPSAKVHQPIDDTAVNGQNNAESNKAKAEEGEEEWGDFGSA